MKRNSVGRFPQLGCAVLFFLRRLQAVRFAPNYCKRTVQRPSRSLL